MKRCAPFHKLPAAVPLVLAVLSLALVACGSDEPARVERLARVTVGDLVVDAEVPVGEGLYRGLAGRDHLPDDSGMLFVFPDPGRHAIWMKGMFIPIDIIWISPEGQIIDIVTALPEPGVPDQELTRYVPDGESLYILEVRAGLAEDKGIGVGDKAQIELP